MSEESQSLLASFLESFTIPTEQWSTAPPKAQEEAKESSSEGIPTAIAHHPEWGWFVLHSGQGPYIAWQEKPLPEKGWSLH